MPTAKAKLYPSEVLSLMPDAMSELIGSRGVEVLRRIGLEEVKKVIADVLCGVNIRDSTESLTRRRLGLLNASTLVFFVRGLNRSKQFINKLPSIASKGLKANTAKQERWLLQWCLGLTTKGVQNILRDSHSALDIYRDGFVKTSKAIMDKCMKDFGPVAGTINLKDVGSVEITWDFMLSLFCAIGSQTLAIRGSEKSTYGKLFERLILGSVLKVLGFKHVTYPPPETKGVFWLSSRFEARESDATALCAPGKAIRFDIGFIGRGNPEISKDKVSRFERQLEVAEETFQSATFVIVDRVGERSKITEQAKLINGTIIQMSMSYWPRILAEQILAKTGYRSTLIGISEKKIEKEIRTLVSKVRIEDLVEATSELIEREDEGADLLGESKGKYDATTSETA